jgi:hypothetical protein
MEQAGGEAFSGKERVLIFLINKSLFDLLNYISRTPKPKWLIQAACTAGT